MLKVETVSRVYPYGYNSYLDICDSSAKEILADVFQKQREGMLTEEILNHYNNEAWSIVTQNGEGKTPRSAEVFFFIHSLSLYLADLRCSARKL